ncbi:cation transporter [Christensenella sp. MSJ-20]|uniref:cation transporter n=1 Tax=Christensenella sp. MSJ-20 TaxID=2841518 RepID=UPI000D7B6666|nr:MAG: heavy metal transporter [Bacillota bacterium]QWT55092.1 cation transporter [Christensenella sp. MSJ-20]
MKKTYRLKDLDCANCAAKMENRIGKINGVTSASISFMTQKLTLEAQDDRFDDILSEVKKAVKKVDSAVELVG